MGLRISDFGFGEPPRLVRLPKFGNPHGGKRALQIRNPKSEVPLHIFIASAASSPVVIAASTNGPIK